MIYEIELERAKNDYFKAGFTAQQWKESVRLSNITLAALGFKDAQEVRRIADRYGKRVFR